MRAVSDLSPLHASVTKERAPRQLDHIAGQAHRHVPERQQRRPPLGGDELKRQCQGPQH